MAGNLELITVTEPEIVQLSVVSTETVENFLTEVAQVEVTSVELLQGETMEVVADFQVAVEEVHNYEREVISESGSSLVEVVESYAVTGVPGPAGPAGPKGTYEDEPMYARKVDTVDDLNIYKGEAAPGSLPSAPVWRIRKYTFTIGDDMTEAWADGTAEFDKVWDNRTGYVY